MIKKKAKRQHEEKADRTHAGNPQKRVEFLLKAIVKVEFWDGLDNHHLVARMSLVWGKSYKQVNFKGGKKKKFTH